MVPKAPAKHRALMGVLVVVSLAPALTAQATTNPESGGTAARCQWLVPRLPHVDTLRKVCEYAVTIPERMPNFVCSQKTARYLDGQAQDTIAATVTYEHGSESYQRESYQRVKRKGRPPDDSELESGTWSTGQYAADIRNIFDTVNRVTFQFVNESKPSGRPVLIFAYSVDHQDIPQWLLQAERLSIAPPYHGQLWIDEESHTLLRMNAAATTLPDDFPMRSADVEIEYGDIPFGDGTSFVLPVKAVVNNQNRDGHENRNVLEFLNCHKFRGTARILPQNPSP